MLILGATAANADTASMSNCTQARDKVNTAIAANPQGANNDAASKESHYGRDFCAYGMFDRGMQHYNAALKLLGAS
jgi:hypothetical protein